MRLLVGLFWLVVMCGKTKNDIAAVLHIRKQIRVKVQHVCTSTNHNEIQYTSARCGPAIFVLTVDTKGHGRVGFGRSVLV